MVIYWNGVRDRASDCWGAALVLDVDGCRPGDHLAVGADAVLAREPHGGAHDALPGEHERPSVRCSSLGCAPGSAHAGAVNVAMLTVMGADASSESAC